MADLPIEPFVDVVPSSTLEAMAESRFAALGEVERLFLRDAQSGTRTSGIGAVPDARAPVRPSLVRWLCENSQALDLVHAKGIFLDGAVITGALDLAMVKCDFPLILLNCDLSGGVQLAGAAFTMVRLDGSTIGDLDGSGLRLRGSLHLFGAHTGGIVLRSAEIPVSLNLDGARLANPGRTALNLEGAVVGFLLMRSGFRATGLVRMFATTVHNTVECDGRITVGRSKVAVLIENSTLGGPVLLRDGFRTLGTVRIFQTTMAAALDFRAAALIGRDAPALQILGCRVQGALTMIPDQRGGSRKAFRSKGLVEIRNVLLSGSVFLDGAIMRSTGKPALVFVDSTINGRFQARDAHMAAPVILTGTNVALDVDLREITVKAKAFPALDATGVRVGGSLSLEHTRVTGGITLARAFIADHLRASGARVRRRGGPAMILGDATIGAASWFTGACFAGDLLAYGCSFGSVVDFTRARVVGKVELTRARVAGHIHLGGAYIRNPGQPALYANQAQIDGSFLLGVDARIRGRVSLYQASIAGDCYARDLQASEGGSVTLLDLANVRVGGSISIHDGRLTGLLRLASATVGSDIHLDGTWITSEQGLALDLRGALITGEVSLDGGFESLGRLDLDHVRAGGSVRLDGCLIETDSGCALQMRNARVGSTLSATAGRFLVGAPGIVDSDGNQRIPLRGDRAVDLSGAVIEDRLLLGGGIKAFGRVVLDRVSVGGDLDLAGARLAGDGTDALSLSGAQIGGDLVLGQSDERPGSAGPARATGAVALRRATVEGDCDLSQLVIDDEEGLDATRLVVRGNLDMSGGFATSGAVRLDNAAVGVLVDDEQSWTRHRVIGLAGLTYGGMLPQDVQSRLRWLRHAVDGKPPVDSRQPRLLPGPTPSWQPLEQYTQVLKREGREADARLVLIEKQRQITRHTNWPAAALLRRIWGATIAYGYRPQRAALLAPLFIGGLALGLSVSDPHIMRPSEQEAAKAWASGKPLPKGYPQFQPLIYAIDTFVPVVKLGESAAWRPDPDARCTGLARSCGSWLQLWIWIHIAFGALITGLAAAGYAGLVRKD